MNDIAMTPEILKEELIFDAKWLKLVRAEVLIRGQKRQWIYCTRKGLNAPEKETADAVVVVPFVRDGDEVKVVLVREYRAPLKGYQYAFPAGLIDAGESVESTAARELAEETGYRMVNFVRQSPLLAPSAGLTDETFQYAFVEAEYNGAPTLESSEDLEVHLLSLSEITSLLKTNEKFCGRTWPLLDQFIIQKGFPI